MPRHGNGIEMIRVRGWTQHREVRLCVDRGAVWITQLRIDFERGAQQRATIGRNLTNGSCSPSVAIRRGAAMRSVTFTFGRLPVGMRPLVRLQAR